MDTPATFALLLAQMNPIMGDIEANLDRIRAARAEAVRRGAQAVMFPELFLLGYPPEDLVTKPALEQACRKALDALARETADAGPALIIGTPWRQEGQLYNAMAVLDGGRIAAVRFKVDLPNYGVFDEKRVFAPGPMPGPVMLRGIRFGLPICEDIWQEDIVECLSETGAEILLVANGSPYEHDKIDSRLNIAVSRLTECGLPLVYLNQVGGQDELVFDGASFGLNPGQLAPDAQPAPPGRGGVALAFQMPAFAEALHLVTFARQGAIWRIQPGALATIEEGDAADYAACVLGLRDYVEKNNFPGVVLGMSGGVDSALCCAMAADALGADKVHAIMLPYRYTSQESFNDAMACATALGVRYDILPIAAAVEGLETALAPLFAGTARNITEENIQSRARGTLLMSISNKFGPMVVTTGNKSEMSVGYATLYGDMNGGFNPIKDLYKTQVFRLCHLRNRWKPPFARGASGVVIPENIITKPPTAELRENQKDQDSLPEYAVLDDILACLVEKEMLVAQIAARGHDIALVRRIEHLLSIAEYKRRQSAPGVKITRRNFGRDRRYPITNRFRDALAGPYAPEAALQPEKAQMPGRPMMVDTPMLDPPMLDAIAPGKKPVYRFAPSPTGYLHIGNARTALWNALLAKKHDGSFILRFDDTDLERSRPEYAAAILEDLAWLGLRPDRIEHQSARRSRYVAALEDLKARGLAYACYETPEELERKRKRAGARGLPPVYDRAGARLSEAEREAFEAEGRRPHYRFRLSGGVARWHDGIRGPCHIETSALSDPVLVREDGTFLYTFASVLDDIDMGVTDILRGEDHVANTAVQIELFRAFGVAAASLPRFAHHNLITTLSGEEMSKRKGTLSLRSFREAGFDPLAVALVAVLTGTSRPVKEVESLAALAALLDEKIVSRALTKFDPEEIRELSTRLLHHKPFTGVAAELAALGISGAKAEPFWLALRGNLTSLAEARQWWEIFFTPRRFGGEAAFLAAAAATLPPAPFDEQSWAIWTKALAAASGRKGKELFMPLRLALTGREHGPELRAVLPLMERDEILSRLAPAPRS